MPVVTVVSGLNNPNVDALRACIKSVLGQKYKDWEWCVVADYPIAPRIKKLLTRYANKDSRIRLHIRNTTTGEYGALQEAIDAATGMCVAILHQDAKLHSNALFEVAAEFTQNDEVDYLYSDEDIVNTDGTRANILQKPDYDPIRLMTSNYCSNLSVFRSNLLDQIGGIREQCTTWSYALPKRRESLLTFQKCFTTVELARHSELQICNWQSKIILNALG